MSVYHNIIFRLIVQEELLIHLAQFKVCELLATCQFCKKRSSIIGIGWQSSLHARLTVSLKSPQTLTETLSRLSTGIIGTA